MEGSFDENLAQIKSSGYDGWEDWVSDPQLTKKRAAEHGLSYLAMAAGNDAEQFRRDLNLAVESEAVKVTVHCGGAHLTFDEGLTLLNQLVEVTQEFPIEVNFETHRGRLLYEPLSTYKYLQMIPDLWLAADFSHWTVVTESLLDFFQPQLQLAIQRTRHLHARVGHEEGPQVPDPRGAQWANHTSTFAGWWDQVIAAAEARGDKKFSVDPEFGPANYMWTDPQTGQPLADLWEVTLWMKQQLQARWSIHQ